MGNLNFLLMSLIEFGQEDDFITFFERVGGALNAKDPNKWEGRTLLIEAADHGRKKIVDLLLASKANPDEVDNDGRTALMYVVVNDTEELLEIRRLLLQNKADVNIQDKYGNTALIHAARAGCLEQVKCL